MSQHFNTMLENSNTQANKFPQVKQQQQQRQKEDVAPFTLTPTTVAFEKKEEQKNIKTLQSTQTNQQILKPVNAIVQIDENVEGDGKKAVVKHVKRLKNSVARDRKSSKENLIVEVNSVEKLCQEREGKSTQDLRSRAGSFRHVGEEGRSSMLRKPVRLKNIEGRAESFDTLHLKGHNILTCSKTTCMSSMMAMATAPVEPRKPDVVLEHARDFLDQYFTSIKKASSDAHESRLQQVRQSIESSGAYQLTEPELIYGSKLAWRNSSRCIGRIQWSKLQVFDCRNVTTTSGMFEAICNHIKYATNKGNLRSAITIFPQRTDGRHDYRIWNAQLINYAGYKGNDGKIIGDPINVEFTEMCTKLGWRGKGTEWDILPLVVSANGHDPEYFEYSPELILEVPLSHPK